MPASRVRCVSTLAIVSNLVGMARSYEINFLNGRLFFASYLTTNFAGEDYFKIFVNLVS